MEGPQLRRESAAVSLISCASFGYWTPWDWDETWMYIYTYIQVSAQFQSANDQCNIVWFSLLYSARFQIML